MAQFKTTLKELEVKREYKGGANIEYIFQELKDKNMTISAKPTTQLNKYEKAIWMNELKNKSGQKRKLNYLG